MKKISLAGVAVAAVFSASFVTSCDSGNELGGGSGKISRIDLSGGEALTTFGASGSRAVDGSFDRAGTFKIDENGNVTAIGFFINEDGKETRSKLTVSPGQVFNLTDNYIYFSYCSYYDEDGDPVDVSQEYNSFIVRRSDGLVYSTYGMRADGGWSAINSSFVEEPSGSLLASFYTFSVDNPGFVGRITLSRSEGLWQQLSSDNSPIKYADYPKVFLMNGGVVATSYFAVPINTYWVDNNLLPGFEGVGVIYPNGGYDTFSNGMYAVLDAGILDLAAPRYISIGNSYGQCTVEPVNMDLPWQLVLSSWYETDDKVILKSIGYSHEQCHYQIYDKQTKQLTRMETGFEGEDNMELWKDNLCNGRFYGLMRQNGKLTKVVWLDPVSGTTGQIAIPLADEIDITYWGTDYSTGKAQVSGTRRSDGYNVAVSIDLQTGKYEVLFSDPHRKIVSLIPLH